MHRFLTLVALVACGATPQQASIPPSQQAPVIASAPPSTPVAEEKCKPTLPACILPRFEGFRDRMCACQDKACADKVNEEMGAWGQALSKDPDAGKVPPTDDQVKQMSAIATAFTDCMTKAITADSP